MVETAEVVGAAVEFAAALRERNGACTESDAIDAIAALENLKGAIAAAQAGLAVEFDGLRRDAERARGVPVAQRGRGVAAEVGLARRESPAMGSRSLGLARALAGELPHTRTALEEGRISEWRATIVCKETAWLSVEDRLRVDEALAPHVADLGNRQLAAEARRLAQRLDTAGAVAHLERAAAERRVSIRPAPGSMAYLTALLPLTQAVAAYASLTRAATSARATGEAGDRSTSQVMVDTLVERLTGQERADAVPVEIELIMPSTTLLADGAEPAWLPGHGPLPAEVARKFVVETDAGAWVRRLYAAPDSGELVAMDSRRREFTGELRKMIRLRDDVCRSPWCDAPIRHIDHVVPVAAGGATTYANGSGLCESCNYVKESGGWGHRAGDRGLEVMTPTGHTYAPRGLPLGRLAGPAPPGRLSGPDLGGRLAGPDLGGRLAGPAPPSSPVSPGSARSGRLEDLGEGGVRGGRRLRPEAV